jgi:beta-galactosidase beta subunit
MIQLARFENFEYKPIDMILEEWRLPTYQDTIKKKLSFLKNMDLTELEPVAVHTMEIKELWRKLMKKMYTKDNAEKYIELVDNYDVHHLTNIFDVIKKIKDSVVNKEDVGYLLYHDKLDKIFYENPISYK